MEIKIPSNSPAISDLERMANRSLLIKLMTNPKAFYESLIDRLKQEIELDKFISTEAKFSGILDEIKDLKEFQLVQNKLSNLTYEQLDFLGLLDNMPVILKARRETLLSKLEIDFISSRNPIQPPKQTKDVQPIPDIPKSNRQPKPNSSQLFVPGTTSDIVASTPGLTSLTDNSSVPPFTYPTPGTLPEWSSNEPILYTGKPIQYHRYTVSKIEHYTLSRNGYLISSGSIPRSLLRS